VREAGNDAEDLPHTGGTHMQKSVSDGHSYLHYINM
jgi:hypothetical protein